MPDGARSLPLVPPKLKLGRPKAAALAQGTTSGHPQCSCAGFYFSGNWHHGLGCPETTVVWRLALGRLAIADVWPCEHHCAPEELSVGWTHAARCPFWDTHPRTDAMDVTDEEELPF